MLNLTPAAAEQILRAASAQQTAPASSPSLRIAAKVEAGELVYGMGFDDERENDAVIEAAGVTLLIAPLSQEFLVGATLDFVELRPGEFQFIFTNPNTPAPATSACASRSSGCGSCGSGSAGGCN
jgi:iron-sulfur cluster assembly protein